MIIWVGELSSQNMKLSVSNGIKLLLKRVYQKFTNGSRTKKSTPKGVSPLSVLLLFTLIVKYKKHNYFWMGGVSIISGTLTSASGTISDLKWLCLYYLIPIVFTLYSFFYWLSRIYSLILPLYKRLFIFPSWISCIVAT